MNVNKNWSDFPEDLENSTKKIKGKISQDELVEDLKDSLNNTINSTKELIKNILVTIESTVNDEAFIRESKEMFKIISKELESTVKDLSANVKSLYLTEKYLEEE